MNKQQRMINTEYYEYTNVNPKNKFGGDCVVRAIANATNQTWEQTVREMTELGIKLGFVLNDHHVYEKYLLLKGFVQAKEPRDVYNQKITVVEFIRKYKENNVIVMNVGSHHVSCIKNGKVNDIWDCSKETMHKYWYKVDASEKVVTKRRFCL